PDRVHDRPGGGVEPADQQAGVAVGHQLLDLRGGEQLGLHAPGHGRGHPTGELLHPLGAAGDLDPTAAVQHAQLLVLTHGVHGQVRDLLGMVDGEHEVRGVARRSARIRQRPLVELDDVSPPELCKVADGGIAHHPGPYYDDVCTVRHLCHGVLPNCRWYADDI